MKVLTGTVLLVSLFACGMPGGYSSISVTDDNVVKAGRFAVENAEKPSGEAFVYEKVLRARKQVVAGANYDLCVSFKKNGQPATAETVVYQDPENKLSITSWTEKGCS